MIKPKREVNELAARLGLPPPYDLASCETGKGTQTDA